MKGNNSNDKVVSSINRYMGLANLAIIAVNPTSEEMQKLLGMDDLPKEPVYAGITVNKDKEDERQVNKIRLVLRGTNQVLQENALGTMTATTEIVTAMHDLFVSDTEVRSKTGKPRILNSLGVDTWQEIDVLEANEKMKWFTKNKPLYKSREGEIELLGIFKEFLNLSTKDECAFKDYTKIANGEVGELKKYITEWPKNAATFLLGVREAEDGKEYQAIYNKCFGRPSVKSTPDKFVKALSEEYGEFKAVYSSDLKLRVYSKKIETPDSPSTAAPAATSNGGGWV